MMFRYLLITASTTALAIAQSNFPPPPTPTGNPITHSKALLGMALFWDEQLSVTGTVACGTCHQFQQGGTDARALHSVHPGPDGAFGTPDDIHGSPGVAQRTGAAQYHGAAVFGLDTQITPRRAPSVINVAYHPKLFYDGRAESTIFVDPVTQQSVMTGPVQLENLIAGPPVNAVEMGAQTWPEIASRLLSARPLVHATDIPTRLQNHIAGNTYLDLFQFAFGTRDITPTRIIMALATYLRTLNSDQSRFDLFLANQVTLKPLEQQGMQLFTTPIAQAVACSNCHGDFNSNTRTTGPIVGQMALLGFGGYFSSPTPVRLLFHNTGVRPVLEDRGRATVTAAAADQGTFRTPSLRNVTISAPFLHNGSAQTLREVLEFYNRGGDFHVNQAPGLTARGYTEAQLDALEAVLSMLTDTRVTMGQAPFDSPRLLGGSSRERSGVASVLSSGLPLRMYAPLAVVRGQPLVAQVSGVSHQHPAVLVVDPMPGNFQLLDIHMVVAMSQAAVPVVVVGPQFSAGNAFAAEFTTTVPNLPQLVGTTLYAQWFAWDNARQLGFAASEGYRFTVL